MHKRFSVASWNVEHFGATDADGQPQKPIEPIIEFLAAQNADVVALYEVRSKLVFRPLMAAMPEYQFHVTEGPQMQEILVGVKKSLTAMVTQKLTFQSGQSSLRPGVLCTLMIDGDYFPLLFLHLKSMTDPKGFGLRDDMLKRARDFRKTLDAQSADGRANYIFLGDLNTMGLDYPYTAHDISAEKEISELGRRVKYRDMQLLSKNAGQTFRKPSPSQLISDLDHVVAAEHLQFTQFEGASVDVRGWPTLTHDSARDQWNQSFSDHALLYFEVLAP